MTQSARAIPAASSVRDGGSVEGYRARNTLWYRLRYSTAFPGPRRIDAKALVSWGGYCARHTEPSSNKLDRCPQRYLSSQFRPGALTLLAAGIDKWLLSGSAIWATCDWLGSVPDLRTDPLPAAGPGCSPVYAAFKGPCPGCTTAGSRQRGDPLCSRLTRMS
jgi:hypothetical protein